MVQEHITLQTSNDFDYRIFATFTTRSHAPIIHFLFRELPSLLFRITLENFCTKDVGKKNANFMSYLHNLMVHGVTSVKKKSVLFWMFDQKERVGQVRVLFFWPPTPTSYQVYQTTNTGPSTSPKVTLTTTEPR